MKLGDLIFKVILVSLKYTDTPLRKYKSARVFEELRMAILKLGEEDEKISKEYLRRGLTEIVILCHG